MILRMVEGPHAILQPFQGSWMKSFEKLKYHVCHPPTLRKIVSSFEGLKDWIQNTSKGWRIEFVVLQRVEVLCEILGRDEGLLLHSFEGLKHHMLSFNPSKDDEWNVRKVWRIMCNLSTLTRITKSFLRRVDGLCVILQPFEGLCNH